MKLTPGDFGSLRGLFYEKRKVKSISGAHGKAVSFSRIKTALKKALATASAFFWLVAPKKISLKLEPISMRRGVNL